MKIEPKDMLIPMVLSGDQTINQVQYAAGDFHDAKTEAAARYLEIMHIAKRWSPDSAPTEGARSAEVVQTDGGAPDEKATPQAGPISIGQEGTRNDHETSGERLAEAQASKGLGSLLRRSKRP